MIDSPSCETRLSVAGDATGGHCKIPLELVDYQSSLFDGHGVGIPTDDAVELIVDDASTVCRILHRRMMACEKSVKIVTIQINFVNSQAFNFKNQLIESSRCWLRKTTIKC